MGTLQTSAAVEAKHMLLSFGSFAWDSATVVGHHPDLKSNIIFISCFSINQKIQADITLKTLYSVSE